KARARRQRARRSDRSCQTHAAVDRLASQVGGRGQRRSGTPRAVPSDRGAARSGRSRDLGTSARDVLETARRPRRKIRCTEAEEARPLPARAQGHRRAARTGAEARSAAQSSEKAAARRGRAVARIVAPAARAGAAASVAQLLLPCYG